VNLERKHASYGLLSLGRGFSSTEGLSSLSGPQRAWKSGGGRGARHRERRTSDAEPYDDDEDKERDDASLRPEHTNGNFRVGISGLLRSTLRCQAEVSGNRVRRQILHLT